MFIGIPEQHGVAADRAKYFLPEFCAMASQSLNAAFETYHHPSPPSSGSMSSSSSSGSKC